MATTNQNQGSHLTGTVHDWRKRAEKALDAMVGGNKAHAGLWLNSFNKDLRAKPADLMKTKTGAASVAAYLERMGGR
jgi:hypothetical protein